MNGEWVGKDRQSNLGQPASSHHVSVIIAIGASTGGPPVLQTILSTIPKDLTATILIVQHITQGFTKGLAQWLAETTGFPVSIGQQGEIAIVGHAYLAPDNRHMGIDSGGRVVLDDAPAENGLRPSISFLFRSALKACGSDMVGIVLTGMGKDGAQELLEIKRAGGITIAQDKDSSVVHGIPGAALKLNAAKYVMKPMHIARALPGIIEQIRARHR